MSNNKIPSEEAIRRMCSPKTVELNLNRQQRALSIQAQLAKLDESIEKQTQEEKDAIFSQENDYYSELTRIGSEISELENQNEAILDELRELEEEYDQESKDRSEKLRQQLRDNRAQITDLEGQREILEEPENRPQGNEVFESLADELEGLVLSIRRDMKYGEQRPAA